MAVLTKAQFRQFDMLFYDAPALKQAVDELRILNKTAARDSANPTQREAVENIAEIPTAMTYDRPEAWLRVVQLTWGKYHGTEVGKAMCRRYKLREKWQKTSMDFIVAPETYFRWRKEFILSAALFAAREGLL